MLEFNYISTAYYCATQHFNYILYVCPKDSFPFPRIDQLVDTTAGHELLSMMDVYSRYNQIKMSSGSRGHKFYNRQGIYCYNVMPFSLKNAGATY